MVPVAGMPFLVNYVCFQICQHFKQIWNTISSNALMSSLEGATRTQPNVLALHSRHIYLADGILYFILFRIDYSAGVVLF